jgi:predicted DNA-binding WGR domain protein
MSFHSIEVHRLDPVKNMRRFYRLEIAPLAR